MGAGAECKPGVDKGLNRRRLSSSSPDPTPPSAHTNKPLAGGGSVLSAWEKRKVEEAILPCRLCIFITMYVHPMPTPRPSRSRTPRRHHIPPRGPKPMQISSQASGYDSLSRPLGGRPSSRRPSSPTCPPSATPTSPKTSTSSGTSLSLPLPSLLPLTLPLPPPSPHACLPSPHPPPSVSP